MNINKIVETCIYSSDLDGMKRFYVDILDLPLVQEEKGKLVFLQAGKSMLSIFNPSKTSTDNDRLPTHGAQTPPACIHFAMEIGARENPLWKELLDKNKITIEKEVNWKNRNKSLYFATLSATCRIDNAGRVAGGKLI